MPNPSITVTRGVWLSIGFAVLCVVAAACGGGGDDPGSTPAGGTTTVVATKVSGTPGAATSKTAGTASAAAGSPGATTGTPVLGAATPLPVNSATAAAATSAAELGGDIAGGDPAAPRQAVSTIPAPPAGSSPVVDSTEVAPPAVDDPGLKLIVDLDAATFGIQSTRTVKAGDVFQVAIVMANIPEDEALGAFNFFLDYDHAKIVAPSYANGSSTDRNPDLNEASMGGGWQCLPAPEGDVDDPGGIEGDGNPATGRALISCFNVEGHASGTVVLATVEFHAASTGSTGVILSEVAAYSGKALTPVGMCAGDSSGAVVVPCEAGTVTIE